MIGAVENKTFAYERTFSEIKRLSTAGLEGPGLLRRTAGGLRRAVPGRRRDEGPAFRV
jgi:hypothetical protein